MSRNDLSQMLKSRPHLDVQSALSLKVYSLCRERLRPGHLVSQIGGLEHEAANRLLKVQGMS